MTRIYEFSGTHREVGRAHGEELRAPLRESLDARMSRCVAVSRRAGREMDVDAIRALAGECLKHVGDFSPGQLEEVEGMAEGAGVSPEDVLVTSGYTDFRDVVGAGKAGDACECTAIWAGPGATTEGKTFVAQTWDMFSEAEDTVIFLKICVEGRPEVFTLSYAGCAGMMGTNSSGVALAGNNLTPTDPRPGVPWTFLCREILACESAEAALAAMKRARLCSGHNFLIGDSSGAGFSVETTGNRLVRLDPEGPAYAHSNHYLSPELREVEKRPPDPKSSTHHRLERMNAILEGGVGSIDRAFIENALRDHDGEPASICAHDYELSSGATVRSCAAIVMDTVGREAGYIKGNPCRGDFATFGF